MPFPAGLGVADPPARTTAGSACSPGRASSPPFTASRWRTFWTTTPCFSTGAAETSSADTGSQKAGTVSSLPTMQRSAGQASAAGRVDKRPSVRSAFAIWWKTLVPIFHLCFACEVWQFFSGQTKKLVCKPRYVAAQTGFRYGIILFQLF